MRSRSAIFALFFGIVLAISGCSGCDDSVSDDDVGVGADVDVGEVDDVDASVEDATEADADANGPGEPDIGDPDADDPDADVEPDADNGEDDACPFAYQMECGGECVAVNTNPDHCGECDNECEGEEACVGGECTTECMGDLELCDNQCVDLEIDSANCGACGDPCDDGEGCVGDGECVETVDFGPGPQGCEDGGPPVDIDFGGEDEVVECSGNISQSTFLWALCSCSDLEVQDELLTDGFNSSSGPYQPGGLGGGVGVNGDLWTQSYTDIWGALFVGDGSDILFEDEAEVYQRLYAGGGVGVEDDSVVREDAYITGDIDASANFDILGILHQQGTYGGSLDYGDRVEQSVTVDPPCRCDGDDAIPVGDIVDAAAADNDNDAIGLDEDLFASGDAPRRVELPCGRYYFSEMEINSEVVIVAEGRTAIFVDGDVYIDDRASFTPGPTGELDIFVAGDFHANDEVVLGSPSYPASTRLYVGGDDGLLIEDAADVGGNIYVVPGTIELQDELDIFGAIYGQNVLFQDNVAIHYDRQVAQSGEYCPEPDDDNGDNGDNGNGDDNGDNGNGENDDPGPQCSLADESCTDDEDCCAPLICDDETETCSLMQCLPSGDDCSANDECCSGICAISGDGEDGECIEL